MKRYRINSKVEFKAPSLGSGKVVELPTKDNNKMYTIELESGKTIRCTRHYLGEKVVPKVGAKWRKK
tara:strand:+ start:84 stop:284 length:201 start_codon:yes stop_codon:yes gene_type:complete